MTIRTFQPGDEAAQVSLYNEAAADLPRFKPATLDEVRRRCQAPDFDPSARFFAVADGRPVGYAGFRANGRVSFPWCRKGHEAFAEPLMEHVLEAMRARGLPRAFAAYRADWPGPRAFLERHGFAHARDMVNFALDLTDMPTPAARAGSALTPLTPSDLPAVQALGAGVLRAPDAEALEAALFRNPYFPPEALFALRGRAQGGPLAVGVLVTNPAYAHPKQVDPGMPCFRLGAFGTEGMQTKRFHGLFSFLAAERDVPPLGLDLLGGAAMRLHDTDVETFSAQVPSDAPALLRFYKQHFRQQASFPVYERPLSQPSAVSSQQSARSVGR